MSERKDEVCQACRAVGYGNATCSWCVRQWSRFGISQDTVDQLLAAIGNQLPDPPIGAQYQ